MKKTSDISFKSINKLAIPAIIAGIAEPLLSITDTAIVGNIPLNPTEALAAVGIAGSFISALVWILAQTRSAISAIVSKYLGSKKLHEIASLPDFTNERGQGYYDSYFAYNGNWGATFGNWGRNGVNANGQIRHPYRASAVFTNAFPAESASGFVDYKNYKSQENFFRTGVAYNNNISINGGGKDTSYNVYFGNLDDSSFMPGNQYKRYNVSLGGSANLTNKFSVSSTLNYTNVLSTFPSTSRIFRGLFN